MGNTKGSRNRYDVEILSDLRKEMDTRIDTLRIEQAGLVAALELGFSDDVYRKLSIINHRIEVATIRHRGDWLHGNFLDYASTVTSK